MKQHRYLPIPAHALQLHAKAPQPRGVLEHFMGVVGQRVALVLRVAQGQAAVAAQVHVPDLNIGLTRAQIVLLRQGLAQ